MLFLFFLSDELFMVQNVPWIVLFYYWRPGHESLLYSTLWDFNLKLQEQSKTEFSSFEIAHYPLITSDTIQRNFRMKKKGWNTPDNGRNPIRQVLEGVTQGHPERVTQRQHSSNKVKDNKPTYPTTEQVVFFSSVLSDLAGFTILSLMPVMP